MKRKLIVPLFTLAAFLGLTWTSCDVLDTVLSDSEITEGLKEALRVGTDTAVFKGSKVDGYFGNALIKILMPEEATPIVSAVSSFPLGASLIDEVVLKLNRAAEEAATEATPIFVDAITNLTISDALGILNGHDRAATEYLDDQTTPAIISAYQPKIEDALTSVGAQQAWGELTNLYNTVPFVQPVNTDLAEYTTIEAKEGLFHLVGNEEELIRQDPVHRVNEILENVFGDNQ